MRSQQDGIENDNSDSTKLVCLLGRSPGLTGAVFFRFLHNNARFEYSVTAYLVCIIDGMFVPNVSKQCWPALQ